MQKLCFRFELQNFKGQHSEVLDIQAEADNELEMVQGATTAKFPNIGLHNLTGERDV